MPAGGGDRCGTRCGHDFAAGAWTQSQGVEGTWHGPSLDSRLELNLSKIGVSGRALPSHEPRLRCRRRLKGSSHHQAGEMSQKRYRHAPLFPPGRT
eukprot:scaffold96503_cov54-Phaeocystis_antarctica.AAC.2